MDFLGSDPPFAFYISLQTKALGLITLPAHGLKAETIGAVEVEFFRSTSLHCTRLPPPQPPLPFHRFAKSYLHLLPSVLS